MCFRWSDVGCLAIVVVALAACGGDESSEASSDGPTPYEHDIPSYFPVLETPADNPTTVEGVALGRQLYYDARLSNDGRRCGGCHLQANGFSAETMSAPPPVMPHVNLGWSESFLWNGAKTLSLEDMMLFEVVEFFEADFAALSAIPEYPPAFAAAFGDEEVTAERTARALAQFERTLVSANSRFDRFLRGELELTAEEQLGYVLFNTERGDCFHCHGAPLMTDGAFHNNGLDAVFTNESQGRYLVTGAPSDMGRFKTPTLRNVALRGPYMHDGRYASLAEVIDHYDSGVQLSDTLDPIMTKPGKEFGLQLSADEKAALVAFLESLSDDTYANNPDLSDVF